MSFDKEAFLAITSKTHTEQAHWFLNGFWADGMEAEAEKIWEMTHIFLEVQLGEKVLYGHKTNEFKEEADLEEHKAHRLLEMMGETQTVMALRKRLKALDIDNNHRMAITEFLLDRYKKTPAEVIAAPQGDIDPVKLAAADKACQEAADALSKASNEAAVAQKALKDSHTAADEAAVAKKAAEDALSSAEKAEAVVKAAEAELQAAINEIEALEKTKADKISSCQAIIDSDAGTVKKGKAVQEKEALLSEDELPLRKAKITQGAALKKVTKARVLAEDETAKSKRAAENAAAAKEAADAAAVAAAAAKEAAEAAAAEAEVALKEANDLLTELKNAGGTPNGKIWWMERVLKEKQKFMKR